MVEKVTWGLRSIVQGHKPTRSAAQNSCADASSTNLILKTAASLTVLIGPLGREISHQFPGSGTPLHVHALRRGRIVIPRNLDVILHDPANRSRIRSFKLNPRCNAPEWIYLPTEVIPIFRTTPFPFEKARYYLQARKLKRHDEETEHIGD